MNVYILTEITKRELDSNLLLAFIAAMNGSSVLISNMDSIEYLSQKKIIKKGIFHTKSILHDERKQKLHENLFKSGFKLTSIDEENGLIKENLDNFCEMRFSEKSLKFIHKIFCWGNKDYNAISSHYKNFEEKLCKTGTPRCDLWKKKFIEYWKNPNIENNDNLKQVLISLNFALVNGFDSFEKIIQKLRIFKYFERSQNFEKEIYQIAQQNKKDLKHFKDLINYLSKEFKNVKFLVRPHPKEKKKTWENLLDIEPNITINNDNSFNDPLTKSEILIQNGCTTAFQAALYDLPVISYVVEDNLDSHGKTANKLGIQLSSKEQVKNMLNQLLSGKKIKHPLREETLNNNLFIDDEKLSSFKIYEEWKILCENDEIEKNDWNFIRLKLFLLDLTNIFKKDYKFEKIQIDEINSKLRKIRKILDIKETVRAVKISNKSFLIKKDNE